MMKEYHVNTNRIERDIGIACSLLDTTPITECAVQLFSSAEMDYFRDVMDSYPNHNYSLDRSKTLTMKITKTG